MQIFETPGKFSQNTEARSGISGLYNWCICLVPGTQDLGVIPIYRLFVRSRMPRYRICYSGFWAEPYHAAAFQLP